MKHWPCAVGVQEDVNNYYVQKHTPPSGRVFFFFDSYIWFAQFSDQSSNSVGVVYTFYGYILANV